MKLKSLILGSVAAAGLTSGAFAADLGVLTSLDVCDALGLSGLTISSDTNCLQISGGVSYELNYGDYRGNYAVVNTLVGTKNRDDNDSAPNGDNLDWNSKIEAWLKFVGTSDSDFGPASAVIKLKGVDQTRVLNEGQTVDSPDGTPFKIDQAYVSVGSDTVLMVGKKGTIGNFAAPIYNFTTLFGYDVVDAGTFYDGDGDDPAGFGGTSIQLVTTIADGVKAGIALENIADKTASQAGTLLGVLTYSGETLSAHATVFAKGIMDGNVNDYGAHLGAEGTFDAFKLAAAFGYGYNVAADTYGWAGTLSGQATFDMFKIALSGEALGRTNFDNDYGIGGSVGATVTDGVSINLGGKYYWNNNGGVDGYHVAAQLVAAVTETIKATGEVGVFGNQNNNDYYGSAVLAWTPDTTSGGFTSSLGAEAHQNGAYKVTFKASKSFQ